jgi:hypothetical protein
MKAQPGHLKHSSLLHKQDEQVRASLVRAAERRGTSRLAVAVKPLGWKAPDIARQGQAEYAAGCAHGRAGGEKPRNDKGNAFYGGWQAGLADREDG